MYKVTNNNPNYQIFRHLFLVAEHFSQFLFYVLAMQAAGKDGAVGGEEDGVGDGGDNPVDILTEKRGIAGVLP